MKKILFGLLVCALLVGMTGVVSATDEEGCCSQYCKVTGGGTMDSMFDGDHCTISFTAQGTPGSFTDVKGKVDIVNHETKEKKHFDIFLIDYCRDCGEYIEASLLIKDNPPKLRAMVIRDYGEGAAAHPDTVWIHPFVKGDLRGNAQVIIK